MAGLPADGKIVLLGPAFLQTDDFGRGDGGGNGSPNFLKALDAIFGQIFETPAIVGQDIDGRGSSHSSLGRLHDQAMTLIQAI